MNHPVFVRPLSEQEQQQLHQGETQARHLDERNRFRAVLLSAKGKRVQEICDLLDMGLSTVRGALRRFRRGGPAGLRERPRSGRPAKVPL